MKKSLFTFSNATKAFALVGLLAFSACSNGVSTSDVEKTKEGLNESTNPNTVPGSAENTAVTPTNATDPQAPTVTPEKATTITFEKEVHDFGTVKEGDEVTYVFKFKNSGDKPLLISDAKGSCGCTVPDYPKNPIAPGEKGEIKVKFNSKGKPGAQTKFVTLNANTIPAETRLTIKANVIGSDVKTK
jgi:hypothetical protein